jgi:hypothetical protein
MQFLGLTLGLALTRRSSTTTRRRRTGRSEHEVVRIGEEPKDAFM